MWFDYLLIILIFFSAILTWINENKREDSPLIPSWIFLFIIILVVIIQGNLIYQKDQMEKHSAETGLLAINDSEFQNIIYKIGSNEFIGFQNQTIIGRDGKFSVPCDKEILSTKIVEDKLKISSFLYDENGHIIAKIVSNEWTVNPKFMFDKNFDTDGFEVIDDKDNVILQIEKHGNVVEIRGDFYCNGMKIYINDTQITINTKEESTIIPMFRYPAINYHGERISSKK